MRRSDRARDRSFAFDVIDRCGHGVAALSTGGEGPYCIPLSLVRVGDDLFFHCALEGRKLDLLRRDPRVQWKNRSSPKMCIRDSSTQSDEEVSICLKRSRPVP